ncbi:hypothetical protein HanRHA438_Chr03g0108781 [Helianthus annuus]|nr:hypothetical protein HanRHA438_Chr03g0108781 [Helianthus annuus]
MHVTSHCRKQRLSCSLASSRIQTHFFKLRTKPRPFLTSIKIDPFPTCTAHPQMCEKSSIPLSVFNQKKDVIFMLNQPI